MSKRQPPSPYRSLTPWTGFTPREKKRAAPLPKCPSPACRRAKKCLRAIDQLYCRRTHVTPAEVRHAALCGSAAARRAAQMALPPSLPPRATFAQVQAYRMACDLLIARAEEQAAAQLAAWKAGQLDHLYGRYDGKGVWMRPPPRDYVEG